MKISQVMTPTLETLQGGDSVVTAAKTMKRLKVDRMVVLDHMHVVGILTARNIIEYSTAQGIHPRKSQIRDIMTSGEIYCTEDQDLREVKEKMDQMNKKYFVVLDSNGKPLGTVSHEQLTLAVPQPD